MPRSAAILPFPPRPERKRRIHSARREGRGWRIVELSPELLPLIRLTPESPVGIAAHLPALAVAGHGWAMLAGGLVVAAGGLVPQWPGRAVAWMLFGEAVRPRHRVAAFHFARAWMDAVQSEAKELRRIDCTVPLDFAAGHRYARRLGFKEEALFVAYAPDGAAHVQYVRLAEEGA